MSTVQLKVLIEWGKKRPQKKEEKRSGSRKQAARMMGLRFFFFPCASSMYSQRTGTLIASFSAAPSISFLNDILLPGNNFLFLTRKEKRKATRVGIH